MEGGRRRDWNVGYVGGACHQYDALHPLVSFSASHWAAMRGAERFRGL